jgi:hypothetical protein
LALFFGHGPQGGSFPLASVVGSWKTKTTERSQGKRDQNTTTLPSYLSRAHKPESMARAEESGGRCQRRRFCFRRERAPGRCPSTLISRKFLVPCAPPSSVHVPHRTTRPHTSPSHPPHTATQPTTRFPQPPPTTMAIQVSSSRGGKRAKTKKETPFPHTQTLAHSPASPPDGRRTYAPT